MSPGDRASKTSPRSRAIEAAHAGREAAPAAPAAGEDRAAPADGSPAADAPASGHIGPAIDPRALELIASTGC